MGVRRAIDTSRVPATGSRVLPAGMLMGEGHRDEAADETEDEEAEDEEEEREVRVDTIEAVSSAWEEEDVVVVEDWLGRRSRSCCC